ncbi:putative 12-oxophytodienoate reductase 11 [Phytophthora citrophthora]|uniref:12-oxophytodienoate reductase 11 n=1 Tax=Phytophthora citrophthora TaxID=4793 RepID=A0AAD9GSC3_9STRA|nr:putative 12-oxophytodienoate reductase 11 [Phytophthora citrophthora]
MNSTSDNWLHTFRIAPLVILENTSNRTPQYPTTSFTSKMSAKTVLITGSNRGIGLSFTKHYVNNGWKVIAAARDPQSATDLKALKVEKIVQIDTSDETSITTAAQQLKGQPIDLLINNAGIGGGGGIDQTTKVEMMKQFEINTVGPFLVTRAFLPNLKLAVAANGSATVGQVSSRMGSITDNGSGGMYGYRSSKTALNMVNASLATDLKDEKIVALALHPGYVVTRMTGHTGQTTTEDSVAGMTKIIAEATPEDTQQEPSSTMTSTNKTVLITGCTRGIGLAFAEHYTKAGWNVIGTARASSNTEKLEALTPFKIIAMDTSEERSILDAARQLEGQSIDLLVNNAGIGLPVAFETGTKDALMRQFEVNAVGPFLVTRALLPNLQLAAKAHGSASVVQLSSFLGSIGSYTNDTADFFKQAGYGYATSKTALNMITRSLAFDLRSSDIVVVSVHPGYVDTDMTKGQATLKPADSVARMTDLIAELKPESSGKFFNLDAQIPLVELPCEMSAKTVLITGRNRGIGLSFTKHYVNNGWKVIAAARDPQSATDLKALKVEKIVQIDTSDETSITTAAQQLKGQPIDLLINNAGIGGGGGIDQTTKAEMMKQFEINTVGPFLVTRAFLPNLKLAVAANGSATVGQVSSRMGSIADNGSGGMYGYRSSKTALNMVNASLATDLKDEKIVALALHPGYVVTRMTGHTGQTTTEDSVAGMTKIIAEATPEDSGKFFHFSGENLPCVIIKPQRGFYTQQIDPNIIPRLFMYYCSHVTGQEHALGSPLQRDRVQLRYQMAVCLPTTSLFKTLQTLQTSQAQQEPSSTMTSTNKTVLITGCTRGIGLAFAEHYTKAGWNVIGTARASSNTEKLEALAPFKIIAMDTSEERSILDAARQLEGQSIDLLVNNAGIGLPVAFETGTKDALMRQFEVNAVGPFLVTRALLPNLQLAAKAHGSASVVQLSSFLGSIGSYTNDTADFFKQAGYGYATSKTALNMITRSLAFDLRSSDIVVVSVHPGYVDTDMTKGQATLKPADSVARMTDLIAELKPESSGKFFNLDAQIPLIGDLELKNRIVFGPLSRGRANADRVPSEDNELYYEQRAGAGLIITEATAISEQGYGWYRAAACYTDEHVEGWKRVTERVHKKGGKIFMQMWHMGRQSHSTFNSKNEIVSASATPRALETDEIPGVVESYRRGAELALKAGFDGVELHGANGYLIDQFLQSSTNKRTDKYGGSFENRARLLLEIVEAVKTAVPAHRIGVRLAPNGAFAGMGSEDNYEMFKYTMERLSTYGLGYLAILDGFGFGFTDKCRLTTAFDAKTAFKGIVMANNNYTRDRAEGAIRTGTVELVGFGRLYISNPDLAERFQNDWPVNPEAGHEVYYNSALGGKGYNDFPSEDPPPSKMTSIKKTVLITGSTRGIGLTFAEHYIKAGWNVIGTARANSNTEKLAALAPFKIVTLDTSDETSVTEAARQLEGQPIDLLINNAGVAVPADFAASTKDGLVRQFEVNAIGPFLTTRSLLPNLQLAAKHHGTASVVQLSSIVGSIGSLTPESATLFKNSLYGYGASKSALNMITRALALELKENNIVVVAVHPGYVDTDMTGGHGPVKPVDSVASITGFVDELKLENTGKQRCVSNFASLTALLVAKAGSSTSLSKKLSNTEDPLPILSPTMTSTTKKTVLITGSTRGIGLAFAEHYIKAGWNVIGTARANSNTEKEMLRLCYRGRNSVLILIASIFQLAALEPFKIVTMDTSDEATITEAARQLEGQSIDLLINNTGVAAFGGLDSITKEAIMHQFEVNAVSPFLTTRALLPNLQLAATPHLCIGSLTSETDPVTRDAAYAYGASKTALNMITRALSVELSAKSIVVVAVHPGHVATDLSHNTGPLKPEESAASISEFVNKLKLEDTGKFFNLAPLTPVSELPW